MQKGQTTKRGLDIRDAILKYIRAYKDDHNGRSPTIREITDDLKIKSTSVTAYHVNFLVFSGKLVREGGARGLSVK
jgi:hypothetical protein